jgi:hypothetical protein
MLCHKPKGHWNCEIVAFNYKNYHVLTYYESVLSTKEFLKIVKSIGKYRPFKKRKLKKKAKFMF